MSSADVTNLQASLDAKAPTSHTHAISEVTNLQTELNGKAASSHTHVIGRSYGAANSTRWENPNRP